MIGKKIGMLTVIARLPGSKLECSCECGDKRIVNTGHFNTGKIKSCGCHVTRHGHGSGRNRSREYICYHNMVARCCKPSNKRFKDYGGKGIVVCDRWLEGFQNFLEDMGLCPDGMTIDRKDNRLPYTPDNCRWATRSQNQINRGMSRIWIIDGFRFTSMDKAGKQFSVSTATISAWCKGRITKGRTYPPRKGCSYEMVYEDSV